MAAVEADRRRSWWSISTAQTDRVGPLTIAGGACPTGIRNQFLAGTWDATRVLLEATPQIKATAARLPYVGRFAG